MRADNFAHLIAAAARRRETTLQRAHDAITHLQATGQPVSIAAVAQAARVSRSWLYAETPVRDQITAAVNNPTTVRPPATAPASDASLRRRLEVAHNRIRELTDEVRRLRDELARTHGLLRAHRTGQ